MERLVERFGLLLDGRRDLPLGLCSLLAYEAREMLRLRVCDRRVAFSGLRRELVLTLSLRFFTGGSSRDAERLPARLDSISLSMLLSRACLRRGMLDPDSESE